MKRSTSHLWPMADHAAFAAVYAPGDIFDDTRGPGAHLAEGTRRAIRTAYRRWLGFVRAHRPEAFPLLPEQRITPDLVRAFIEQLVREVRPATVLYYIHKLGYAARLIAPESNWHWLRALERRLAALVRPEDRYQRLLAPWLTLHHGMELMDDAVQRLGDPGRHPALQYRDGLLLALISVWPIRRRSIAALTVSSHLEISSDGITIQLSEDDTKAKRAESFRVPEELLLYMRRYLTVVRPQLLGEKRHDGFWASHRGQPLVAGRLYDIVRFRLCAGFGKKMGLHDFRRAAATFTAMEAPEEVGLIPGVLQHASPDVSERHYNLARSVEASRRFADHMRQTRGMLRAERTS